MGAAIHDEIVTVPVIGTGVCIPGAVAEKVVLPAMRFAIALLDAAA
jgi:hypothetical protein